MKTRPKPPIALAGIVAALASLSLPLLAVHAQTKKAAPMNPAIDVNLDEESAVKVAEAVLVRVYGDKVLGQKPWQVTREGDVFAIKGTLLATAKGGVASIKIRKTNAEVVAIIHGK